MKGESEKYIMRRIKIVVGQLDGVRKMIEQQRAFTDIYTQISSVKASVENIEVMLCTEGLGLDKRHTELFKIINKNMDALKKLRW